MPVTRTASPFGNSADMSGPGADIVDVSTEKHATEYLSQTVRAIRADGAGTLVFYPSGRSVSRTITMVAGEVFDLCYVDRVLATSTATGLLGFV